MPPPDQTPDEPTPSENNLQSADQNENEQSPAEELKHMFDDDIEDQNDSQLKALPSQPQPPSPSNDLKSSDELDVVHPVISDPEPDLDTDQHPSTPNHDEDEDEEEPDLFTKLLETPAAVTGIVTDWMSSIQTNGPAAMSEVLSFVVRASRPVEVAPTELITSSMIVQNEPAASIALIAPILSSDISGRIVFAARDPASKRTKRAYEDFWRRIASEATEAVLFDTDCFDTLISWLEAMASAKSRALRMAACLAAYRVVDGFIDVGARIRKRLGSMQRQLVTEKKKCGHVPDRVRKGNRSVKPLSKKGQELSKKVDEMTANNGELVELSDKVFRSMFVLKFRDIAPEIRALSVSAVGDWIIAYPDHFLDDIHSKYIGWLLSDKDPTVRKSSLQILSHMLESKDFFPSLEHFLGRFCARIVDMSRDKDDAVTVAAIQLLTRLVEFDLLEPASCEQICDLALEETNTDIRRAAGEFMARLVHADEEDRIQGSAVKKGKVKKKSQKRHRPLRRFVLAELEEIPSPEHAMDDIRELLFTFARKGDQDASPDLMVDSVWDHMPALRCWEAFSRLLSEKDHKESSPGTKRTSRRKAAEKEEVKDENALSAGDKAVLCELLLASIREACGKGDKARAKLVERGECNSDETPGALASKHFISLLPNLLVQFQVDTRALAALVQLPMYLPIDTDAVEENNVDTLITKLVDVLTRHTGSPSVVNACANSFKAFLANESPLKKTTHTALQKACTTTSKDLTLQVRTGLSKAEPTSVAASILQVRVICELIETSSSIWNSTSKLLMFQCEESNDSELSDDVTTDAIRASCALIMWSLSAFNTRIQDAKDQDVRKDMELEVGNIGELGNEIVMILNKVCNCVSLSIHVRVVALQALLTVLTLTRGVENFAASVWVSDTEENETSGKGDTEPAKLDFLGISSDVDEIYVTVKSCIKSLLEYELFITGHNGVRFPGNKRPRRCVQLTEQVVRDCFVSLLQASMQSVLSKDISYLPLLGLLLRDRRGQTESTAASSVSVLELCRRYYKERQTQEPEKIREEARALSDVALIDSAKDRPYHFVRELAEALSAAREPGHMSKISSREILLFLCEEVLQCPKNNADLPRTIGVLSCTGMAFVSMISRQDADSLLAKMEKLEAHAFQDCETEIDSSVKELFETYCNALKALSLGQDPEVPKLVTSRKKSKSNWASPSLKTKKRKQNRLSKKDSASPALETVNVRRSARDRKQIDYARLDGATSGSDSEEDITSQLSASDEEANKESSEGDNISLAAAMARNLMEYNHAEGTQAAEDSKRSKPQRNVNVVKPSTELPSDNEDVAEKDADMDSAQIEAGDSPTKLKSRRSSRRSQKAMKTNTEKAAVKRSGKSTSSNQSATERRPRRTNKSSNAHSSALATPSSGNTGRREPSKKLSSPLEARASHKSNTSSEGVSLDTPRKSPRKRGAPGVDTEKHAEPEAVGEQGRSKRRQSKSDGSAAPSIVRKRQRRW